MGKITKAVNQPLLSQEVINKTLSQIVDYKAIREKLRSEEPKLNDRFREVVIEPLKEELNEVSWQVWIEPLVVLGFENDTCVLFHSDAYCNSWVNEHYKNLIEEKLGKKICFKIPDVVAS